MNWISLNSLACSLYPREPEYRGGLAIANEIRLEWLAAQLSCVQVHQHASGICQSNCSLRHGTGSWKRSWAGNHDRWPTRWMRSAWIGASSKDTRFNYSPWSSVACEKSGKTKRPCLLSLINLRWKTEIHESTQGWGLHWNSHAISIALRSLRDLEQLYNLTTLQIEKILTKMQDPRGFNVPHISLLIKTTSKWRGLIYEKETRKEKKKKRIKFIVKGFIT